MKNQRRSRRHLKAKAAAGAFSDRHAPPPARRKVDAPPAGGAPDPWLRDWPVFGIPAVTLLPDGTVLRWANPGHTRADTRTKHDRDRPDTAQQKEATR